MMEFIHSIAQFFAEAVIYLFADATVIFAIALFIYNRKQKKEAQEDGQADE